VKLTKHISKLTVALLTVLALGGANVVSAETSNTYQAPQISTNQGLTQNSNSTSGGLQKIQDGAQDSNKAAENLVDSVKQTRENVSQEAGGIATNIAGQVQENAGAVAGQGSNKTNLDINQALQRLQNLSDDLGTNAIALFIRILYYGSFLGIFVGLGGVVLALFIKKMRVLPWIGTAIFCSVIYGLIIHVMGISLGNNPLVEIARFVLGG
jgi:hypothetical protein